MLTLALNRPRLRWVERLTEHHHSQRLWAERGLSSFSFAVGGYAWATLFVTLHGQLSPASANLVRGAAYILIAYAALTHFEPFVGDDETLNVPSAMALYGACAILSSGVGAAAAEVVRASSIAAGGGIARVAFLAAALLFVASRLISNHGWFVESPTNPASPDAPSTTTRTQERSTKA